MPTSPVGPGYPVVAARQPIHVLPSVGSTAGHVSALDHRVASAHRNHTLASTATGRDRIPSARPSADDPADPSSIHLSQPKE